VQALCDDAEGYLQEEADEEGLRVGREGMDPGFTEQSWACEGPFTVGRVRAPLQLGV
jgi:hypothetical protein